MDQCVEVTKSYVTIGDLGKLECKNKTVVNRLKPIKLLNDNSNGKKRYIVSIMKIFEIVDKEFENALYLGKKRYDRLKNEDPRKAYQKIGNHLAYKGFNYDIIKKVLNKLFNDVDEYSC